MKLGGKPCAPTALPAAAKAKGEGQRPSPFFFFRKIFSLETPL
jgi:hypothetical protein